jgi:rhodanese-related sulfurtransferase
MTATRRILPEFVAWLETAYGDPERGAGSKFAVGPPPETLAIAEVALEAALKGDRPVLFATSGPVRSVIAALVLRRAGVTLEQVFRAELTDAHFDALADALRTVKTSGLLIEMQVEQPGPDACADH